MAKIPDIKRKDVNFETVEFFVCACSACGRKQEIFPAELHDPRACEKCGAELDFSKCDFEVPDKNNPPNKNPDKPPGAEDPPGR